MLIVSTRGSNVDLLHVLFGSILGIDNQALLLVASIATATLAALALLYRPLLLEGVRSGLPPLGRRRRQRGACGLPGAGRAQSRGGVPGARHADGGRADDAAGRRRAVLGARALVAGGAERALALAAAYVGLLLSYDFAVPSGPAIILTAGLVYALSVLLGRHGSIRETYLIRRHRMG